MQPTTPALPMSLDRFRRFNLQTRSYRGFYAGRRLTRKLFSEISGISVPCLKLHDHDPSVPFKPLTIKKLVKLQLEVGAQFQICMIDRKAEIAAAKLAAKAERERARLLDKMLDAAMRAGRKPLSRKSKQQAIF